MKYRVGDILRSKDDMRITILNGKNEEEDEEIVNEGEYFIIIDYGVYKYDERHAYIGWTLLSQKSASRSRWDENYCELSESFIKE